MPPRNAGNKRIAWPSFIFCVSNSCTNLAKKSRTNTPSSPMNVLSLFTFGGMSLLIFRTAVRRALDKCVCGFRKRYVRYESNFLKRWLVGINSSDSSHRGPRHVAISSGSASTSLREADEVTPPLLEVFLFDEIPVPFADRRSESPEWSDKPSPPFSSEIFDSKFESQFSRSSLQ